MIWSPGLECQREAAEGQPCHPQYASGFRKCLVNDSGLKAGLGFDTDITIDSTLLSPC